MRKIVVAVMSTISGLVLLFSYHTSTNSDAATPATTDPSGSGTEPTASASTTPNASEASGSASGTPAASTSSGSSASGTYTGDVVETRWGSVQVRITVQDGRIVSSDAIEYPTGNHEDQEINAYAIPQLNAEVVEAQSASIDAVSGATVTSDGYIESLQSAIDQANL
jgi:uncharacterized protein with FMN-binding domain